MVKKATSKSVLELETRVILKSGIPSVMLSSGAEVVSDDVNIQLHVNFIINRKHELEIDTYTVWKYEDADNVDFPEYPAGERTLLNECTLLDDATKAFDDAMLEEINRLRVIEKIMPIVKIPAIEDVVTAFQHFQNKQHSIATKSAPKDFKNEMAKNREVLRRELERLNIAQYIDWINPDD